MHIIVWFYAARAAATQFFSTLPILDSVQGAHHCTYVDSRGKERRRDWVLVSQSGCFGLCTSTRKILKWVACYTFLLELLDPPLNSVYTDVSHIVNIRTYKEYLNKRIDAYGKFRVDHVKATMTNKVGRLRHLSVPDGLLKETTVLQDLIQSILNTRVRFLSLDGTG